MKLEEEDVRRATEAFEKKTGASAKDAREPRRPEQDDFGGGEPLPKPTTKRGLVRARRHGVVLGRPSIMRAYRKDIRAMSAVGLSGRKIASELGVPASSVFNELRRINQEFQEVERLESPVDQTEVWLI